MPRRWLTAVLPVCLCTMIATGAPDLKIEGFKGSRPTLNYSDEELSRARARIKSDHVSIAWLDSLTSTVKVWEDRDPAWVKTVVPPPGACFAYGFTGCPICGSDWRVSGDYWEPRASFDNPGHVVCKKGHVLPDKDHPDAGTGYVAPDKRIHYFVGSYNTYVAETLSFKIAEPYSAIYAVTGDDKAGRMGVTILDELARIYPTCTVGSWDYPSDHNQGRFNRPFYQTARTLVRYAKMYELLYTHPAMNEASCVQGMTRRQNIEKNLLLNGAEFCHASAVKQGGLTNGQADYVRGALAVGVLLGVPEYVKFATDGPSGIRTLLANNIDREGRYFETSYGYGVHTRNLYITFAEPLLHYRGSYLPNGLNLYDDPRLQACLQLPVLSEDSLGHFPTYGDDAPQVTQTHAPYPVTHNWDVGFAGDLAARVSDPETRKRFQSLWDFLRKQDRRFYESAPGLAEWYTFCAPDSGKTNGDISPEMRRLINGSFFFGQKGMATLRRGTGEGLQMAMLRYGPSLVHGHEDDLNVSFFGRGYDLAYDIGYMLGSTHTQVGFAHKTVSHNTVVVNEATQGGGMGGGSLLHFATFPGFDVAEGSSTAYATRGVKDYRRLIALTPDYMLDVFRVRGGSQHDLPMHSLSEDVDFEGITLGPETSGSLAGPKYHWGELQLNDGDMKGYPNKPYWNPPPGNGYGFIVRPRTGQPGGPWSANWKLNDADGTRFQMLVLDAPGTSVTAGVAPGLYPNLPKATHVVRRRAGKDLSSCFVAIWQSSNTTSPPSIVKARYVGNPPASAEDNMVLALDRADARQEYWFIGANSRNAMKADIGTTSVHFEGALARAVVDKSRLLSLEMLDAKSFEGWGWKATMPAPAFHGRVKSADPAGAEMQIEALGSELLEPSMAGAPLLVISPRYTRNSAYVLADVDKSKVRVKESDLYIGVGLVDETSGTDKVLTSTPHEYARAVYGHPDKSTGVFDGKMLVSDDGRLRTRIKRVIWGVPAMTIELESNKGWKKGMRFHYQDVSPGDEVTVQHHLSITHDANGKPTVASDVQAKVTGPDGREI